MTCSDVKAAFGGVYQSVPIAELNAMSDAEFEKCVDVFGTTKTWSVDHLAALKTKLKSVRKIAFSVIAPCEIYFFLNCGLR